MSIVSVYFYLVIKYYYSHTVVIRSPVIAGDTGDIEYRLEMFQTTQYPASALQDTPILYSTLHTSVADTPFLYSGLVTSVQDIVSEIIPTSSENTQNHLKILIFTQTRSGSSFTASLLSSVPGVFYVFEPFKFVRVEGVAIETAVARDNSLYSTAQTVLSNIFHCNITNKQIDKLRKRGRIRGDQAVCENSTHTVVKTVRMRRAALEQWIGDTDIKIVHLVRDPRGVISSRRKISRKMDVQSASRKLCESMLDDMKLRKKISGKRYFLLRYEDLVDSPKSTLTKLYNNLDLPITQKVLETLYNLTHADKRNGYYGLIRSSSFTHDSWKHSLSAEIIRNIEDQCQQCMQELGYSRFRKSA